MFTFLGFQGLGAAIRKFCSHDYWFGPSVNLWVHSKIFNWFFNNFQLLATLNVYRIDDVHLNGHVIGVMRK